MVKFQKVPMVLIEERVYRGDTIDFDKKGQHNFARIQMKITLLRLKLLVNLTVFHAFKAGEVMVKLSPHFCLLGIYFNCKLS